MAREIEDGKKIEENWWPWTSLGLPLSPDSAKAKTKSFHGKAEAFENQPQGQPEDFQHCYTYT